MVYLSDCHYLLYYVNFFTVLLPKHELCSAHLSGHTFRFCLQENELSSVLTQTVPLEVLMKSFHLSGHTFRFCLTVQDLEVSCLVKFAFGSERVNQM